jgi:hypothetical protein
MSSPRTTARKLLPCIASMLLASAGTAAAEAVSLAALRSHLEFLASDALEGRDTGTRGYEIAALYASGAVPPVGARAGQRRVLPAAGAAARDPAFLDRRGARHREPPTPLAWKHDYVSRVGPAIPEVAIEAPVVFAGFGIDASAHGRADYDGIDVAGKIVLVLSGAPADFASEVRAHYASSRQKRARRRAAARSASSP